MGADFLSMTGAADFFGADTHKFSLSFRYSSLYKGKIQ
jgi:hypothetical protein